MKTGALVIPVDPTGIEYLSFAQGDTGWAIYVSPEYQTFERRIFVRFGQADNISTQPKIVAKEVYVSFRESVGPRALRDLPVVRMEAAVNQPAYYDAVLERAPISMALMKPFPWSENFAEWWHAAPQTRPAPELVMDIPSGRPKPDRFYEQVAERFGYLTVVSKSPATDLAEANNVPVTTVHGWVKEARRRGLLPSGQRSRHAPAAGGESPDPETGKDGA